MMLGVEHLLILLGTLFPPLIAITLFAILFALFGGRLGLREFYVKVLIKYFEWGARQIKSTERIQRKDSCAQSRFTIGAETVEDDSDDENRDDATYDTDDEVGSGLKRRYGSSTSIASIGSVCSIRSRRASESSTLGIIKRETQINLNDADDDIPDEVFVQSRGWAVIRDSCDFAKAGIEAIIEDEVTSRFEAEQLMSWNMLTRTRNPFYQFINWKVTTLYYLGFFFRWVVLLPLRLFIFVIGLYILVELTALVGLVPVARWRLYLGAKALLVCHRILSICLTGVIRFHDTENRPTAGGICVANHTSPIDAMILSNDYSYSFIGQTHGGLLGVMQRALSRATTHIWFDRSETKDREKVAKRLRDHCSDPTNLPILIFPEGTCINNTSVMMFKKGCFEVGATIYPVAMKYDSRFGDAFWNSSEQSWFGYIIRMMTSWAIICNVYYLPPMNRLENESSVEFANRVKKAIAKRGGLVDLEWDGGLKRARVPPKMVEQQQQKYANRMARYTSTSDPLAAEDLQLEDYNPMAQVMEEPIEDEDVFEESVQATDTTTVARHPESSDEGWDTDEGVASDPRKTNGSDTIYSEEESWSSPEPMRKTANIAVLPTEAQSSI